MNPPCYRHVCARRAFWTLIFAVLFCLVFFSRAFGAQVIRPGGGSGTNAPGGNVGFNQFDTNQFGTNGVKVHIKTGAMATNLNVTGALVSGVTNNDLTATRLVMANANKTLTNSAVSDNGTVVTVNGQSLVVQGAVTARNRLTFQNSGGTGQGDIWTLADGLFGFSATSGSPGDIVSGNSGTGTNELGLRYNATGPGFDLLIGNSTNGARLKVGMITIGNAGTPVAKVLSATAALDFGSILAAASADLTITVTGAATGDAVTIGLPAAPDASTTFNAFVSSANTVTVRCFNVGTIAVDPVSATYRAVVFGF